MMRYPLFPRDSRFPRRHAAPARAVLVAGCLLSALLPSTSILPARATDEAAAIERRLSDATRYLASDELEGRGAGTKGLDLAAEFIARQFTEAGLKTDLFDGKPFQKFTISLGHEVGKENKLTLIGPPAKPGEKPQTIELTAGRDFTPLALGGSAAFDLPLLFAGYGITGNAEKYDDYQGIDAARKAVILLRHEPQQDNPNSAFNGVKDSHHAPMAAKLANAKQHKAAAVIFCTDELEIRKQLGESKRQWHEAIDRLAAEHDKLKKIDNAPPDQLAAQCKRIAELLRAADVASKRVEEQCDPLLHASHGGGLGAQPDLPVLHCRRAVLDRVMRAALNTDLAGLERQIDQGPTPHSKDLPGWRAAGKTDVRNGQVEARNVVAVLPGEGPKAEETIVVGAHYDHIGRGGPGGLGGPGIYHGADDNASGTAVLMEVARGLAQRHEKLPRRVVFAAFSGEERGILGSGHYVKNPLFPLDKTVAMVNLDMVGHLNEDRVTVMGSASGKQFGELLDRLGQQEGLKILRLPGGPGPSDQMAFYNQGVPVIHYYTGMHANYHRPSDTADTLSVPGMRRIARLTEVTVVELAKMPGRPEFVKSVGSWLTTLLGEKKPFFGITPALNSAGAGCGVAEVFGGGPAERAGLRPGDAIVEFAGKKIGGIEDFLSNLRSQKAGDKVKVLLRRGNDTLTVEVTLDPPR